MKKLAAIALCLMLLVSSFAMAEEAADESVIVWDEELITATGIEGDFVALEDLGLMFYCPANLLAVELTEEDLAAGNYAMFATEDMTFVVSVGCAPVYDTENNQVTDLESLAALYTEQGIGGVAFCTVNELPCITYSIAEAGMMGVVMMTSDGEVLAFNFGPVTDESTALSVTTMGSSIMPIVVAE